MKHLFTIAILAATIAHGGMIDTVGTYHATAPRQAYSDGVVWQVNDGYWLDRGWRISTEQEDEANAPAAPAKSAELMAAENAFLWKLNEINQQFDTDVSPADGFAEIGAKLKASTSGERIDRIEAALELRTLWDVVLFHGGAWWDVQWHEGVEP